MSIAKIVALLRAKREERKNQAEVQTKALEVFLGRVKDLGPLGQINSFRITEERALAVRQRIARRKEDRDVLTRGLKSSGVDARTLCTLTEEADKNRSAFAIRWRGQLVRDGEVLLSQVKSTEPFRRVLVAMRNLYAVDIADSIFVRDVVRPIMERVLVAPLERAR